MPQPITHIDRKAFTEALKSLGVDTKGLYEVHSDVNSVTLKRRSSRMAPLGASHVVETTEILPLVDDSMWLDD